MGDDDDDIGGCDPQRAWRRLSEDPDYVAHWRASAGPTVREAPPHVFRRQTEADVEAGRWKLLAWEDPHHPQWAELFRADVAMVEARVVASGAHAWRGLVRRSGATYTGLRLLDGALVLKVWRGGETGQLRVVDGAAFVPALSGLEVAVRRGVRGPGRWVLVESLDGIRQSRRRGTFPWETTSPARATSGSFPRPTSKARNSGAGWTRTSSIGSAP